MTIPATLEREAAEARTTIARLDREAAEKRTAAEKLVEAEKAAGRNPLTGTTDDDRDSFERIDAAYKAADTDAESAAEMRRRLHSLLDSAGAIARDVSDGDPSHPTAKRLQRASAILVASEQYRRLADSGVLSEDSNAKVSMDPVEILSRDHAMAMLGNRSYLADAGDGNALIPIDQQLTPPVGIPVRMPTVLDLITVIGTDRDLVTWTRQTTRTNAATPTAFGTAASKSRYVWQRVEAPVKRIPHHVVVDKGNLADQAELRGLIDGEGTVDLRLEVEDQILNGAGGAGFTGIYNAAIGSIDASTEANPADALHRAITAVRVGLEREPTAYGIGPEAFEQFYLAKATDGHYLHNRGPLDGAQHTIWGLPATISTAYNTAPIVGDWRRGATYWQRSGIMVSASDNVDDFFLEEMVAVLFTTRGAFAVKQPLAFCTVENLES